MSAPTYRPLAAPGQRRKNPERAREYRAVPPVVHVYDVKAGYPNETNARNRRRHRRNVFRRFIRWIVGRCARLDIRRLRGLVR